MLTMFNTAKAFVAPYALYIKIGLFVLCVAVSATLGYRYGASTHAKDEAQKSVQVAQLASENAALRQANAKNAEAVAEANKIVAANVAKATAAEQQAQTYADEVEKANARIEALKQANLNKARVAGQSEKCQELLRSNVCEAIPLP